MKNTAFLLMVLLCILDSPDVFSQSIYIKHYSINEGLAGNHVYMCHQDAEGYLWIATTSGLSRFDGKKFRNYDYRNGLIDNEVLFVSHDANNNIWVNTFASGPSLSVIKNNVVDHAIGTRRINISEEYYSQWHKNTYLSGNHCLVLIKPDVHPVTIKTPFISGSRFFETENHQIFAGDGYNLYTIRDTAITFFQNLLTTIPYTRIYYFGHNLYAIHGNSVYTYHFDGKKFERISKRNYGKKPDLIFGNKYGLWITFANQKGAILYRDSKTSSQSELVNVPGYINYFCNDNEDGVWIATTDNGMFYIPNASMVNYTTNDGLASSVVYAADRLADNEFWLGYNTGIAEHVQFKNPRINVSEKTNLGASGHSNNPILDIVHNHAALYLLSKSGLYKKTAKGIIPPQKASVYKSLYLLNDSLLAIGGWDYEIYNVATHRSIKYVLGRIYAHAFDTINDIAWAGGIDGIFRIPIKGDTRPTHIKAFPQIKVNALAYCRPYLLIGTQNNGLFVVHKDSLNYTAAYRTIRIDLSNNIKAIAKIKDNLWVGTNKGLVTGIPNSTFTHLIKTTIIDNNDGLICSEINKIVALDTYALVAGYGGISILQGNNRHQHSYTISGLSIKRENAGYINIEDTIRISYTKRGLEIGFQAVSLKYGSEMMYMYQLVSFDDRWKITKNNIVQYTNLPPGDYHFQVYAFDNRGNASPAKTIYVIIMPLWWQTTWFKALVLLAAISLSVFVFMKYHQALKRKTDKTLAQDKLIAHAKLEALRSQLKPHFIFNSLNAIKDYIYNNKNDDAANLLQGFAGLIRTGLHLSDNDFITIEKEVKFLKQYLELEQMKCDKCFNYSIEVSKEINNIVIPSLITQPFVENAVVHGVRSVSGMNAVIQISYTLLNNDLVCIISDNGIGVKKSMLQKKLHYSKGTHISQDRISYFRKGLGIDIALEIQDRSDLKAEDHGTLIKITIKNITQLQNHENNTSQPDSR